MNVCHLHLTQPLLSEHRRAIAVGVFDGVHRAHRQVIGEILGIRGTIAAVLTFSGSPSVLPKHADALETPERKAELLSQLGVDECFEMDFSEIRDLSPEAFVQQILCDRLHAAVVACGENFRFGRQGAGDPEQLRQLCAVRGIEVRIVPTVTDGTTPISSTRIRQHIAAGEMAEANRLLGHNYMIRAAVINGNRLGRTAGFPTVNQPLPENAVLPAFGVYASTVLVDGRSYIGVTNIGRKPTVGSDRPLAETWIMDYQGDLYGQTLTLCPVRFLRPERSFPDTAALFEQIAADAAAARTVFQPTGRIRAIFFDFDDTLHSRVNAWRGFCDEFAGLVLPDRSQHDRQCFADELWELDGCGHGYGPDLVDIPYQTLFDTLRSRWALPFTTEQLITLCHPLFAAHTAVFADAAPTLRTLREMGYYVGVITNGRSFLQNRKLHLSGLLPLLDNTVVAGDEGVSKPDPELFIRTALRAGFPPEDCLYVGDNPRADVAGAAAAGMTPVYMDRTDDRRLADPAVRRITGLQELSDALINKDI